MLALRVARSALSVLVSVLIVFAVALVLRVVSEFFGAIAAHEMGAAVIMITEFITVPFGLPSPRTPYGGVFDSDAAVTVGLVLIVEWGASALRDRL